MIPKEIKYNLHYDDVRETAEALPAQSRKPISLCWPTYDALDHRLPRERAAKTDQTEWMRRLIWVYAGAHAIL